MSNDVGVDATAAGLAKIEADRNAAGIRIWICVWDLGNASRTRKSDGNWGGSVAEVGSSGEFLGVFGGREGASKYQASRMG